MFLMNDYDNSTELYQYELLGIFVHFCLRELVSNDGNLIARFLNGKHFYKIGLTMSKKNTPGKIQEHLNTLHQWTQYKKGLCESCEGLCCYMPVEARVSDLIRLGILVDFHLELSPKEQIKEALKNPAVTRFTPSTEKFTLAQKPDGSCFYLDKFKKCTRYQDRPDTCRNHPQVGPRPGYCAYMKKESP